MLENGGLEKFLFSMTLRGGIHVLISLHPWSYLSKEKREKKTGTLEIHVYEVPGLLVLSTALSHLFPW